MCQGVFPSAFNSSCCDYCSYSHYSSANPTTHYPNPHTNHPPNHIKDPLSKTSSSGHTCFSAHVNNEKQSNMGNDSKKKKKNFISSFKWADFSAIGPARSAEIAKETKDTERLNELDAAMVARHHHGEHVIARSDPTPHFVHAFFFDSS